MLDITLFRENPDLIRADFDKRGLAHDRIDRVIELDKMVYEKQHENSQLRKQKNLAARGIGAAMKAGNKSTSPDLRFHFCSADMIKLSIMIWAPFAKSPN